MDSVHYNRPVQLPIDPYLEPIAKALIDHPNLVIRATPGSGKTTRVPPFLMDKVVPPGKQIWVLEPRRLAAKLSAFRCADERNEPVGESIGYHFRFEKKASAKTRLLFLTEGMFLRRMLLDPLIRDVAIVVLDEFHERSLSTDVAIAILKRLQGNERSDLKLVVMSATLDEQAVANYLTQAKVITVEAPRFPIEHHFLEGTASLEEQAAKAASKAIDDSGQGDILIFLPGMREIRKTEELLSRRLPKGIAIFPLHGELSRDEQEAALRPNRMRKIILSTNIAETSLTIEGVSIVIDGGLQRSASFSYWSGLPRLTTRPISKAAAIQRAGRAGRTGPGTCYRLYSKSDYDHRPPFESPEIVRSDLTPTILDLVALGIDRPGSLEWLERPPAQSLEASVNLLIRLGAIESRDGALSLTQLGKRIAEIPAHPRVGKLLLEADGAEVLPEAIPFAARLIDEDLPLVDPIETAGKCPLSYAGRRFIEQMESFFKCRAIERVDNRDAIARSLLAAYPDRVAKARRGSRGEMEFLLSEGGTARVRTDSLQGGEVAVLIDISETKNERSQSTRYVNSFALIDSEWLLDRPEVRFEDLPQWDKSSKTVRSYSTVAYGQIILENRELAEKTGAGSLRILVENGIEIPWKEWEAMSPEGFVTLMGKFWGAEAIEVLLARIFLAGGRDIWSSLWQRLNREWEGLRSLREIETMEWQPLFLSWLPPEIAKGIDRLLPTHFEMTSGRKAKIEYRLDREPWLESRIQDFFGMKRTPTVLNGKIALTLHLLAPNYRAVQVTKDLEGFWVRDYPRVRKELSRQYPRHAWPESPDTPVPRRPR